MYNQATLIGRLVRDPEYRLTTSGIEVCRFTIAVNRFKKANSEESNADFIRIVTWRRLAEICNQYLKKGKLVAIEGRLQIDSYEKDGQKRYSSEVVADNMQMLDKIGAEGYNMDSSATPVPVTEA
ncbi:single-stranded DNA-binding protein [Candidatus Marinamargulisbacteria bacterium SCGC AG-439-L15]|nr:single-stranded DNA-binding protein [Candidatus Marinamargulisbacteria bacterium SCGC AG-439-L15]